MSKLITHLWSHCTYKNVMQLELLLSIIYNLQTHDLGIPIMIIHEFKLVDGFYNWMCKIGLIVTMFISFSYKPKLKIQNY
jgi:hypothetical protein